MNFRPALIVRTAALLGTITAVVSLVGCAQSPAREVVLVTQGMTFTLDGSPATPNPTIPLRAGERVRLVLRNEAPGMLHDVAIPAWQVEVPQIRAGETAQTTFTVPADAGRTEYECRPHAELMRGVVEVTP